MSPFNLSKAVGGGVTGILSALSLLNIIPNPAVAAVCIVAVGAYYFIMTGAGKLT
jgi:hypothetical protein